MRAAILAATLAALPLTAAIAARTTLDGHEVLVAQTAREMLASGDFAVPTLNGAPRLQKPPLAYWLAAGCFRLFGENELAARLPAAGSACATAALVAALATRWHGARIGLLAGAIQATTWWLLAYGRMALVDSLLTLLVTLGVAIAVWRPRGRWDCWLRPLSLGGVAGLLMLAKGPIGLAILAPPVWASRWRVRRGATPLFKHWAILPAAALFAALAFGWPALVWAKQPDALRIWREQSVERFLDHYGPPTRSAWFVPITLLWLLAPWTPWALWGAARAARRLGRSRSDLILLAWCAGGLMLCVASAGKRAHYLLPALPPFAIFAATALDALRRRGVEWARILLQPRLHLGAAATYAVAFGIGAPLAEGRPGGRELIRRHSVELARERVAVFGTRDQWAIFPAPRPPRWLTDVPALRSFAAGGSGLILAPSARSADLRNVGGVELDRVGPRGSWRERDPAEAFVLWALPNSVAAHDGERRR